MVQKKLRNRVLSSVVAAAMVFSMAMPFFAEETEPDPAPAVETTLAGADTQQAKPEQQSEKPADTAEAPAQPETEAPEASQQTEALTEQASESNGQTEAAAKQEDGKEGEKKEETEEAVDSLTAKSGSIEVVIEKKDGSSFDAEDKLLLLSDEQIGTDELSRITAAAQVLLHPETKEVEVSDENKESLEAAQDAEDAQVPDEAKEAEETEAETEASFETVVDWNSHIAAVSIVDKDGNVIDDEYSYAFRIADDKFVNAAAAGREIDVVSCKGDALSKVGAGISADNGMTTFSFTGPNNAYYWFGTFEETQVQVLDIKGESDAGVSDKDAGEDDTTDPTKLKLSEDSDSVWSLVGTDYGKGDARCFARTVTFYAGKTKVDKNIAYCVDPAYSSPDTGTYKIDGDSNKVSISDVTTKKLGKAMYFLYGGPAYSKATISGLGNKTVQAYITGNMGLSSGNKQKAITHYVLSYVKGSNWDAQLTGKGAKEVKKIGDAVIAAANTYNIAGGTSTLDRDSVTATIAVDGTKTSGTIVYKAVPENTARITASGCVIHDATSGATGNGSLVIAGGHSFYLTTTSATGNVKYSVAPSMDTNYQCYYMNFGSGKQDMVSYYSSPGDLHFSVNWPMHMTLKVIKVDAESELPSVYSDQASLAGAEYTIYLDSDCTNAIKTITTDANGNAEANLPFGKYFVKETKSPVGYTLDPVLYDVSGTNSSTVSFVTATSSEQHNRLPIAIQKFDAETGESVHALNNAVTELSVAEEGSSEQEDESADSSSVKYTFEGAVYGIYPTEECSEDSLIEAVTLGSDNTGMSTVTYDITEKKVITPEGDEKEGFDFGTYYVKEITPPAGYVLSDEVYPVTVTDNGDDAVVNVRCEVKDSPIPVEISKIDVAQKEDGTESPELPGATLEVRSEDGTLIDTWVSGDAPHMIKGLPAGNYTLKETLPPEMFSTATEIAFTVEETLEVQKVVMEDKPLELHISKKDITNGKEIPGATLELKDSDGNLIEEWVSTDTPHVFQYIKQGTYTLTERIPANGYATAETITFTVGDSLEVQHVEMFDTPLTVEISKTDFTNGKEIPGAKLTVKDSDGNVIDSWVSTDKPHKISMLNTGKYTLTEETCPAGYVQAETVEFEIIDTEVVQKAEMKDKPIQVEISKQDITNSKELPGATLIVKDSKGKEIEKWVSTNEPHLMYALPAGDYTLTEITAPKGYKVAETVKFTVKETAEIQHVKMFDSPQDQVTAPKTGDMFRYWPALICILGGLFLVITSALTKKRRSK